jgi:hypothetical protein
MSWAYFAAIILILIFVVVFIYYLLDQDDDTDIKLEGFDTIGTSNGTVSAEEWTKTNMPLLAKLTSEYSSVLPFKGKKISVSLHLTYETLVLCQSRKK